ncbi:MAG: hypothetical protein AAFV32_05170 [Myxococcota bacterium]
MYRSSRRTDRWRKPQRVELGTFLCPRDGAGRYEVVDEIWSTNASSKVLVVVEEVEVIVLD